MAINILGSTSSGGGGSDPTKANINSPTFTGTVGGITAAMVGAATKREYKTANFTAVAYGRYVVSSGGTVVISNPGTGVLGDPFEVVIAAGSATINGTTYSASRFPIEVVCSVAGTPGTWITPTANLSTPLTVTAATGYTGTQFEATLNGVSQFKIRYDGLITFAPVGGDGSGIVFAGTSNSSASAYVGQYGFRLAGNLALAWSALKDLNTPVASISLDGTGILAQRNGTNPQNLRVYSTFTSRGATTTLEALDIRASTGNNFVIQTLKGSSGGTARGIELRGAGTDTNGAITNGPLGLTIDPSGYVILTNLPTSTTGLPTGALYNDAGVIKIIVS